MYDILLHDIMLMHDIFDGLKDDFHYESDINIDMRNETCHSANSSHKFDDSLAAKLKPYKNFTTDVSIFALRYSSNSIGG